MTCVCMTIYIYKSILANDILYIIYSMKIIILNMKTLKSKKSFK